MIYLTVLIKTHHCGVGLEYLLYQVIFLLRYSPSAGSVPVVFILCSSHGPAQLLRRLAEGWHAHMDGEPHLSSHALNHRRCVLYVCHA